MIQKASTPGNEVFIEVLGYRKQIVKVLLVGNNPIELATIYDHLGNIRQKNYIVDVCFDLRDCHAKIAKSHPEIILLDDTLNLAEAIKLVQQIKSVGKTSRIPVIMLKSTNWNYTTIQQVDDYLLKDALTKEALDAAIGNNMERKLQVA
jgi:PleD family two-component response regulator